MKLIQFEPLFFRDFQTDIWPFPPHNHNHYELMFIQDGSGKHTLNGITTSYKPLDIFFLRPEDNHHFTIENKTHFQVIKFLPQVLKGGINTSHTDFWDNLLQTLARETQGHVQGENLDAMEELQHLVCVLMSTWHTNNQVVTELHTHVLRSLLLLFVKSCQATTESTMEHLNHSLLSRIQNYIHSFICQPDKLTITALSKTFSLSESSLKARFKREMEMPLSHYISALKTQLIKERLQHSSQTILEIAEDFAFTDSSHLYRFFVTHTGLAPNAFRQQNQPKNKTL